MGRYERILHVLRQHKTISVHALCNLLHVSGWTVRRDLSYLEENGFVRRYYGGVEFVAQPCDPMTLCGDNANTAQAKCSIGIQTAHLLKSGQVIALGAGTTTTQVAMALRGRSNLTIMTNALNIAFELSRDPGIKITCAGGEVHGDYYTLTGPVTERALSAHFYDVAVVGVSGIAITEGLTVNSQLNAVIIDIMLKNSSKKIVVADASKFGAVSYARLAPLSIVDIIVTDREPAPEFREYLESVSTELIIAHPTKL